MSLFARITTSRPLLVILTAFALLAAVLPPLLGRADAVESPPNVTGTVTAPGGQALAGAYVEVVDLADGAWQTFDVASNGSWAGHVAPGSYELTAFPSPAAPTATLAQSLTAPLTVATTSVTAPTLALRAANVTGVVNGPSGPYAGAEVAASGLDGDGSPVAKARTAADGTYGLLLPPGSYIFTANAPYPNSAFLSDDEDTATISGPTGQGPTLTLHAPNITGTVTLPNGAAAPNAQVDLLQGTSVSGWAIADSVGHFGLYAPGALPATWTVRAHRPYGAAATVVGNATTVEVPASGTATANVQLRTANVFGRVLDPNGQPVEGSAVDAVADEEQLAFDMTDPTGAFGLWVPAGPFSLHARAIASHPAEWLDAAPVQLVMADPATPLAAQDVSLRLANLTGTVLQGDEAAANASVSIVEVTDSYTNTRDGGRFGYAVPAGAYTINADPGYGVSPRWKRGTVVATVVNGTPKDVEVPLTPANVFGRVLKADGSPASMATLRVVDLTTKQPVELPQRVGDWWTTYTGEYGWVLPPGTYRVTAAMQSFGSEPTGDTVATEDFVVDEEPVELDLRMGTAASLPMTYEKVSRDVDSGEANDHSFDPAMSGDARWVAWESDATDLTDDDVDGTHVYLHDRQEGTTTLVSVDDNGAPAGHTASSPSPDPSASPVPTSPARSEDPDVDASGQRVVFTSNAPDLAAGDTDTRPDVYLRDTSGTVDRTIVLSQTGEGTPSDGDSGQATISADGDTVAFTSTASDLPGNPPRPGWNRVYVLDLSGETPAYLSAAVQGEVTQSPALSADGSTLAYLSEGSDAWEVRVHDLATHEDVAVGPVSADHPWMFDEISISDDGSRLAYRVPVVVGETTEWQPRIATKTGDAWTVADPQLAPGAVVATDVSQLRLSGDGSTAVFVAEDGSVANGSQQAWLQSLTAAGAATGAAELATVGMSGDGIASTPELGDVSTDGERFAFGTSDRYVMPEQGDAEWYSDVFVGAKRTDLTAPTWPDEAELRTTEVFTSIVQLEWDAATDPSGISKYRVLRTGAAPVETAGQNATITGLNPDTAYTFQVQARDAFGNWTSTGPELDVRTLASASTGNAFLTAVRDGSAVDLTWEAATGATGYRVMRASGDGAAAPVTTLPAGTTSYEDSGLDAETTYHYSVLALVGDAVNPHTRTVTITTGELFITSAEWSAPLLRAGLAALGGNVALTVRGERGRMATADMTFLDWYDGETLRAQPVEETQTVALTEDPAAPGTYAGTFALREGVAAITGMTGRIADSADHEATRPAARPTLPVGGVLDVTTDGDLAGLTGARLRTWSDTLRIGSDRAVSALLESIPTVPGSDWSLTMQDAGGTMLAEAAAIAVHPGRRTAATLTPTFPASLRVTVRDIDGDLVQHSAVNARDGEGIPVAYGYTDSTGVAQLWGQVRSGDVVSIVAFPGYGDPFAKESEPHVMTLAKGVNTAAVSLREHQTATLTGILASNDGPVEGVAVTATMPAPNGNWVSSTDETDATGRYTLRVLPGQATVYTNYRGQSSNERVTVTAPSTPHDITLLQPVPYRVRVDLFTKHPGETTFQGPLAIDWRTAVHYRLQVMNRAVHSYSGYNFDDNNEAVLSGRPGDVVQACADGSEAGTGTEQVCAEATLPASPTVDDEPVVTPIELRLSAPTLLSGDVQNADGTPATGCLTVVVTRETADGSTIVRNTQQCDNPELRLTVPSAGQHRVTVRKDGLSSSVSVQVNDGDEVVELPDLRLTPASTFTGAGNSLTSTRPDVVAGTLVDARAAVRNSSDALVPAATLRLQVPADATLVPESLLLDGVPVVGTPGAGFVDVPLGDVAEDEAHVVRYALRVPTVPAGGLLLGAEVRFGDGEAATAESLPALHLPAAGLTLAAPVKSASRDVVLSGRGPANALLQLLSGETQIGATAVSPGGYWRQAVTLPDTGSVGVYRVRALTELDGGDVLESEVSTITVDATRAAITKVALSQEDPQRADGRRHEFDPRDGLARFPFVWVPGQPAVVDVTFDRPDMVSNVVVRYGSGRVEAEKQPDGTFKARFEGSISPGDLYVDFESAVPVIDLDDPDNAVTEDEARAALPSELAGFSVVPGSKRTLPDGTEEVQLSLPGLGDGETATMQVKASEPVDYEPTAEDLEAQRRSGAPVYGTTVEESEDGQTVTLKTKIPANGDGLAALRDDSSVEQAVVHALESSGSLQRFAPAGSPRQLQALSAGAIKVIDIALDVTVQGADFGSALYGAVNNPYESIGALYDLLTPCYPAKAAAADAMRKKIDDLKTLARTYEIMGHLAMVAGLVTTPATLGAGLVAYTAAMAVIGRAQNEIIQMQTLILEDQIGALLCSPDDDGDRDSDGDGIRDKFDRKPHDPGNPLGAPTHIYDPSGYVYEGVTSNRITGVTATVFNRDLQTQPWQQWNADWFGQVNPLVTDAAGRYAWDVPEGWWQVGFAKVGYEPAQSAELRVLPPQLDVNVGIVAQALPTATGAVVSNGGIDLTFAQYMRAVTVSDGTVTVTGPAGVVDGTWAAVSPGTAYNSTDQRARTFRFTPAAALPTGALTVGVSRLVQSYAGRVLAQAAELSVTVPAPGGPNNGGGNGPGGPAPSASPSVSPSASPSASPSGSATPAPSAGALPPATFVPAAAARVLDTRSGTGGTKGKQSGEVRLRLPDSVPADASSVLLNVTVTNAQSDGHVTVFGTGQAVPGTSNLNFRRGQTQANLVLARVGANRSVSVLVHGGPADVVVDVLGSYTPTPQPSALRRVAGLLPLVDGASAGTGLVGLTPSRFLDSRWGIGTSKGPKSGRVTVTLPSSVPSDAKAVLVNLTATGATKAGWVGMQAGGSPAATSSSLNYAPRATQANLVVTPIGPNRTLALDVVGGTAAVLADLVGYWNGQVTEIRPKRIGDTRSGLGTAKGARGGAVRIAMPALPAGVESVLLNVTVTNGSAAGWAVAYPAGFRPRTSNVNWMRGQTQANLVVLPVIGNRDLVVEVNGGTADVVVDVVGYQTD